MANFKSNSFSNLFKLGRKKRSFQDSDSDAPSSNNSLHQVSSADSTKQHSSKKRKTNIDTESKNGSVSSLSENSDSTSESEPESQVEAEHKKIMEREKEYDELLPEKYRKYRPKGFKFNCPDEKSGKPIRVYADGIFDLFHIGHMKQLEQCKKAFANVELVVGVPSDTVTHKLKGLTVLTDKQRCESLKHCKWVDEVIPDCPWIVSPEFLVEHNIDYVAHDDIPYISAGSDDIYKPIKELGKFLVTQRTDGISTSDIITMIIKDYDNYLIRNFARGATRQELNVSWLKQNELSVKQLITKLLKNRKSLRKRFSRRRNRRRSSAAEPKESDGVSTLSNGVKKQTEEEDKHVDHSEAETEETQSRESSNNTNDEEEDDEEEEEEGDGVAEFAKKYTGV